ncbi:uncharacterized protein LOC115305081 [Suricata suricatta]|uniref:uncharacterized protein LOC115305081 n=1 Tax=Suricata suricatta TaxID=37032 RepID=UPI0011554428|nr:uncharacterized protein LOC115305081 [Suricata suricatta]
MDHESMEDGQMQQDLERRRRSKAVLSEKVTKEYVQWLTSAKRGDSWAVLVRVETDQHRAPRDPAILPRDTSPRELLHVPQGACLPVSAGEIIWDIGKLGPSYVSPGGTGHTWSREGVALGPLLQPHLTPCLHLPRAHLGSLLCDLGAHTAPAWPQACSPLDPLPACSFLNSYTEGFSPRSAQRPTPQAIGHRGPYCFTCHFPALAVSKLFHVPVEAEHGYWPPSHHAVRKPKPPCGGTHTEREHQPCSEPSQKQLRQPGGAVPAEQSGDASYGRALPKLRTNETVVGSMKMGRTNIIHYLHFANKGRRALFSAWSVDSFSGTGFQGREEQAMGWRWVLPRSPTAGSCLLKTVCKVRLR